ncbi:hypothetical protein E4634_20560 [Mangrovimicrobium sediminis]|uniref:Uncharacterized protein n=1 Tax=Mangrovimicrobium sediminis TaxID=2562682 RepID=A0A4Z0LUR5_9GAMM|nr:hypothetical protein [Haliea sp. SAOS-164]TGD70994.1 hypothetical protein E4634_20560 [Haliea sp. SAOS-164]
MSSIQRLHANGRLAPVDDPVANRTSWEAAKPGGANFKTQKLLREGGSFVVRGTRGFILFGLVFLLPGIGAVLGGVPWFAWEGEYGTAFFFAVWGTLFGGAGALLLLSQKPLTIDTSSGVYFRGKRDFSAPASPDRERQGSLYDVHAIQLLSESVSSTASRGRRAQYLSYELNFVFADGERINIMDHGKQADIEDAAAQLAAALNIPVWKAGS